MNKIPNEEMALQKDYIEKVKEINKQSMQKPLAMIVTYGCQQNEADSDKMRGLLCEMGFGITEDRSKADLILFNTCAVRQHAELTVFANIGALKHQKAKRPDMIIGLCGCMVQQQHRTDEILKKYPHIDLIFGTHTFYKLPEMLYSVMLERKKAIEINDADTAIFEDIPVKRKSSFQAWITVMYGCNNFCSYCIVPYVRGREKSREFDKIVEEVSDLVKKGYKEFTLLGQNVNSFGKGNEDGRDFADLLKALNDIDGDFLIRFMTSHPKDASKKLIDSIASCDKVAKQLHLPVQSGSTRILKKMNRKYTREEYIELAKYAKNKIPGLTMTSDIIVGFPGETEEDFEDTLSLVKEIEFDGLFTFMYSKRKGTPASLMDEQVPKKDKQERLERLMELQNEISKSRNEKLVGTRARILVEEISKTNKDYLTGRTNGGRLVHFPGDPSLIGQFVEVTITEARAWSIIGELIEK